MLDVVVTVFGVIMGLSPLLQTIRIIRRRHSADVSMAMLAVICFGAGLWFCYGIEHGLLAVIASNAVGVTTYAVTIAIALRYRAVADAHVDA